MTENIELTEQDIADLHKLGVDAEGHEVPYHPLLRVWKELLAPAAEEAEAKVTPLWASRIVASHPGVEFKDMNTFRDEYYGLIAELVHVLHEEIETDEDCLTYVSIEEDNEHNRHHYLNLIRDWQLTFLKRELEWTCTDPDAGPKLAAIGEVHKMFLGQDGVIGFLDNIRFEMADEDKMDITAQLEEFRAGWTEEA